MVATDDSLTVNRDTQHSNIIAPHNGNIMTVSATDHVTGDNFDIIQAMSCRKREFNHDL